MWVRTSFMTKAQRTTVSLAGPFANAVLGVVLLVVTALYADYEHAVFWGGMAFLGFLQVTALVLNLLPIPGLDGYGALEPHLSYELQRKIAPFKDWGIIVLFVLLFVPALNAVFFGAVTGLVELTGVDRTLVGWGMGLTRFWSAWL